MIASLNSLLASNYVKSTLYYFKDQIENGTQKSRQMALSAAKGSSLIALISSVAFTIFGASWSSRGLGFILGVPMIWGGVTVSYLSYNIYHLSKNLQEVNENPKNFKGLFTNSFDRTALKKCLTKDTVCFDIGVTWVVDMLCKSRWG